MMPTEDTVALCVAGAIGRMGREMIDSIYSGKMGRNAELRHAPEPLTYFDVYLDEPRYNEIYHRGLCYD